MGMSGGGGTKGSVSADINVTPLIDVFLVLLIIFLVLMPIMIKLEKLTIPRKLDEINEQPDINAVNPFTVKVNNDLSITFNDGVNPDETLQFAELLVKLGPKLDNMKAGAEKVVFVDHGKGVKWAEVVRTMDSIRGFAHDSNHDEIKVALKIHEKGLEDPDW